MRIALGTRDTETAGEETEDLFASQITVNGEPVDAATDQTAAR